VFLLSPEDIDMCTSYPVYLHLRSPLTTARYLTATLA